MQISNTIFFHVGIQPDWKAGQTYSIGADYTDRYNELMKRNFIQQPDGKNYLPQYLLFEGMAGYINSGEKPEFIPAGYHFDSKKAFLENVQLMRSALNLSREMLFENVRLTSFPDKISRLKSIHLIPAEKKDLGYWLPQLKFPGATIYKLEATGKVHKGDDRLLDKAVFNFETFQKRAEAYWSGAEDANTQAFEWIFQGTVRVLEIINKQNVQQPAPAFG